MTWLASLPAGVLLAGSLAVALAVALRRLRALDAVEILATDVSPDALGLARENAVGHAVADGVLFAEVDLLPDGDPGRFEVVLANLPYVRTDVIATLPRATSFEPSGVVWASAKPRCQYSGDECV